MTKTVTRQYLLVPARETAKAYCLLGGVYLAKSQVQVTLSGEFTTHKGGTNRFGKKLPEITAEVATVTLPLWMADRL